MPEGVGFLPSLGKTPNASRNSRTRAFKVVSYLRIITELSSSNCINSLRNTTWFVDSSHDFVDVGRTWISVFLPGACFWAGIRLCVKAGLECIACRPKIERVCTTRGSISESAAEIILLGSDRTTTPHSGKEVKRLTGRGVWMRKLAYYCAWCRFSMRHSPVKQLSNCFAQFAEPQVASVQLPRYNHPDLPKQNPLVEHESKGSQHAEAADIVWLPGLSGPSKPTVQS